jgi:hypothetical protein
MANVVDPDPQHFAGSGSVRRYLSKLYKDDFYPENFNMLFKMKILKTYDTFDTDEKDKTLLSGKSVTKSKKSDFPTYVKLGVRSACG